MIIIIFYLNFFFVLLIYMTDYHSKYLKYKKKYLMAKKKNMKGGVDIVEGEDEQKKRRIQDAVDLNKEKYPRIWSKYEADMEQMIVSLTKIVEKENRAAELEEEIKKLEEEIKKQEKEDDEYMKVRNELISKKNETISELKKNIKSLYKGVYNLAEIYNLTEQDVADKKTTIQKQQVQQVSSDTKDISPFDF